MLKRRLSKATEVSKNRNGEIAKLEEQLANLKAANKSPTDALNQQVIADLLRLLKCPIAELTNRTKFSLDQNISLQQLLTNANQKLSESQKKIDTLSSQVSRLPTCRYLHHSNERENPTNSAVKNGWNRTTRQMGKLRKVTIPLTK